jgi:MFS family permease
MNTSAALNFAFLALGCILLQPASMKIGRRPVYMFGTLLSLIGCIIGGLQTTVEIYYIVNILTGFGAAPVDSLIQISATDIFFAHERGTRLSLFALALGTGSYLGPAAAGYITEAQSWKWCFWYLTLFFGILFILELFTLDETIYRRRNLGLEIELEDSVIHAAARKEEVPRKDRVVGETEVHKADGEGKRDETVEGEDITKGDENDMAQLHPRINLPLATVQGRRNFAHNANARSNGRLTYNQRMFQVHTQHLNPQTWWFLTIFPFRLATFPAIIWTAIMSGIAIMWLSLLSVTQSEIYSAPPYNFGVTAGNIVLSFKTRFFITS